MAKLKSASESTVSMLHALVTEYYIDMINRAKQDELDLSPADMANIIRFLKDNNVTAMPDEEQMATLTKAFTQDELDQKRSESAKQIMSIYKAGTDVELDSIVN